MKKPQPKPAPSKRPEYINGRKVEYVKPPQKEVSTQSSRSGILKVK